jgi:predicted metal-dependent phosphoesterase TrpH
VLVDFHIHSDASDGALSPAQILERARAAGVSALAITDHDTLAGYREAAGAADGLRLYPGVELSCQWAGAAIHVVGLGVCPDHPQLTAGLTQLAEARRERAATIAARLERLGFAGALAGARARAGRSQLGRPHFAAWLVDAGHVRDSARAFERYLGRNRPGDVKAFWPSLAAVTGWIVAAGGIAVLAHPLHYRFTQSKLRRLVGAFRDAGGTALEVLSGRQDSARTAELRRLALSGGLAVSVGSDFHRDSSYGAPIGVESAPFADLPNVWTRLAHGPAAACGGAA